MIYPVSGQEKSLYTTLYLARRSVFIYILCAWSAGKELTAGLVTESKLASSWLLITIDTSEAARCGRIVMIVS